jgi:hypothetical protein
MSQPVPSRADELLAMSRLKLKVAAGLLTSHTALRAHMFKLSLTQWQDRWLCGDRKGYSMQIVFLYLTQACKRCRTLGGMFLKAKGLENIMMNNFVSLVANPRLGLAHPNSNSGTTIMSFVLLGNVCKTDWNFNRKLLTTNMINSM